MRNSTITWTKLGTDEKNISLWTVGLQNVNLYICKFILGTGCQNDSHYDSLHGTVVIFFAFFFRASGGKREASMLRKTHPTGENTNI